MKIIEINIDEIIPYENNVKKHPKSQIEQIKASILEFGFNDPLAIDEKNILIEGHGRLLALKELGYENVEVIQLKHLTEIQKKQYILAHNKLTMSTGFDKKLLEIELDIINSKVGNVDLTGFKLKETKIEEIEIEIEEAEVLEDEFEINEKYEEIHEIVITAENSKELKEIFKKLKKEGYTCKIREFAKKNKR